jgi:hypothetical protein
VTSEAGSSENFFVLNGKTTPQSASSTVGPAAGTFYAVSDGSGPGASTLIQPFTVSGPVSSVTLSFSLFANSYAGVAINPAGLDWTVLAANQFARVDILKAGASAFDTGSGVLGNFYLGADSSANPHAYTTDSFNITSLVGAGGTFQLRFAEVNNLSVFNLGVDNVSIVTAVSNAPEPGNILISVLGLGAFALQRLARKNIAN